MSNDPISLTPKALDAIKRGGADDVSDDQMLLAELVARAPGMSQHDLQQCFIALRMEYGEDALRAIRTGHVQFEKRKPQ